MKKTNNNINHLPFSEWGEFRKQTADDVFGCLTMSQLTKVSCYAEISGMPVGKLFSILVNLFLEQYYTDSEIEKEISENLSEAELNGERNDSIMAIMREQGFEFDHEANLS